MRKEDATISQSGTSRSAPAGSHLYDIGPMLREETDAVARLIGDVVRGCDYYNEWAQRSEVARYSAAKLAEMAAAEPEAVLVARTAGAPVGFCVSHNDGMGLIWIGWIGVDGGSRRRGLAEALVTGLLETARSRGAHKVWCDTRLPNKASSELFEKLGFEQICEQRNHWYGLDYCLWQKSV